MNKINFNFIIAGIKYFEFKILGKYTSSYCLHKPLHAEIDLTGKCNFNCIWCYRKYDMPKSKHADFNHVIKVINQLKGCQRINLCALGETLLTPVEDLKNIIKACKRVCYETIITTNGSLLKNDISDMILNSNIDKIAVSIDHCQPKEFKKIRGFDLNIISDNVKRFRKLFKGVLQLNVVVTEQTIDNMLNMVDFGYNLGFNNIIFQPVKLYPNSDINYLPPVGIYKNREIFKNVKKKAKKYNIDVNFHKLFFNIPDYSICKQPFYQFSMDIEGFINPCCADKSQHLFFVEDLKKAWNSKTVREFRKKLLRGNKPLICRSWCNNEA